MSFGKLLLSDFRVCSRETHLLPPRSRRRHRRRLAVFDILNTGINALESGRRSTVWVVGPSSCATHFGSLKFVYLIYISETD